MGIHHFGGALLALVLDLPIEPAGLAAVNNSKTDFDADIKETECGNSGKTGKKRSIECLTLFWANTSPGSFHLRGVWIAWSNML